MWLVDLANPGTPVSLAGLQPCSIQPIFSPDSTHAAYAGIAANKQSAVYEIDLVTMFTTTVIGPASQTFANLKYDETGNALLYMGSNGATAGGVFEWDRGSANPPVQLSPA